MRGHKVEFVARVVNPHQVTTIREETGPADGEFLLSEQAQHGRQMQEKKEAASPTPSLPALPFSRVLAARQGPAAG